MKIIFGRSPYSIIINEADQIETKLELYLWTNGQTVPVFPTYTFTQLIASTNQRETIYDIANQSVEFVENIIPDYLNNTESSNMWAYAKVKKYKKTIFSAIFNNWVEVGVEETFIIVNGYTEYLQGVNASIENSVVPLTSDITITSPTTWTYVEENQTMPLDKSSTLQPYVNVIIQRVEGTGYYINYYSPTEFQSTISYSFTNAVEFIKIPLYNALYTYGGPYQVGLFSSSVPGVFDLLWRRTIEPDCNSKYKPLLCSFINRMGGWENIWFLRANEESITTKSTDYNLSAKSFYYNPLKGQKQTFNTNGNKSIKCNTGFVSESLFQNLITELLLSEVIVLDKLPVIVKTKTSVMKTHLKEKNINYEIEFEYKFQLVNTII